MPSSRLIFGVIPWYSFLIVCGICVALLWCSREEKRLGLPKDTTVDLALCVVPCGIVGARLYYVLFAWDMFKDNLLSILYVWQGGVAIYGGIIGGVLAALVFARVRKVPFASLADMITPGLALAQAIGRWGNFFNMEAYGAAITNPAWQFFPVAVMIPAGDGYVWHMATFFYESVWNLGVFIALACSRKRMVRRGDTALWYMLLYGGGRLVIEGLRTDSLMTTGGTARVSQLLSVALCLVVLCVFAVRQIGRPTMRQWIAAALAAGVGIAVFLLLPISAEAFYGYRVAWLALLMMSLLSLGMGVCGAQSVARRGLSVLPLLPLGTSAALHLLFSNRGLGGLEASTLLCCLFTLTCILLGCWLYPGTRPAAHSARNEA